MTATEPRRDSGPPLTIRRAHLGDAEAIAALTEQLGYPAAAADLAARLETLLAREDHAVFAAERTGEIVGWIHVLVALRVESPAFAEIGGLVVADAARGQGIGRRLVAAGRTWAQERGLPTLRVRTNVLRRDALAFYLRLGFEPLKTQGVFALATDAE